MQGQIAQLVERRHVNRKVACSNPALVNLSLFIQNLFSFRLASLKGRYNIGNYKITKLQNYYPKANQMLVKVPIVLNKLWSKVLLFQRKHKEIFMCKESCTRQLFSVRYFEYFSHLDFALSVYQDSNKVSIVIEADLLTLPIRCISVFICIFDLILIYV